MVELLGSDVVPVGTRRNVGPLGALPLGCRALFPKALVVVAQAFLERETFPERLAPRASVTVPAERLRTVVA
jgi:hypothetical protein